MCGRDALRRLSCVAESKGLDSACGKLGNREIGRSEVKMVETRASDYGEGMS